MNQTNKADGVTLREASRHFHVPLTTLHNWLRAGRLTVIKKAELRGQSLLVSAFSVSRALEAYHPLARSAGDGVGIVGESQTNQVASTRKVEASLRSPPIYFTVGRQEGQISPGDQLITEVLFEQWLAYNASLSLRTIATYRYYLADFVQRFPTLPLDDTTLSLYLAERPRSACHQYNRFTQIRAFYHWLWKNKRIRNPFFPERMVRSISQPEPHPRFLEKEQVMRVMEQAANFQESVMLEVFITTAIRAGELVSLDEENIFPDHIEGEGKTGKYRVNILPFVYEDLMALAASHNHESIFVGRNGKRMRPDGVYARVRKCMEKAGITGKKLGPHTLRHSFAHIYQQERGDLVALQKMLKHKRIETTRIYAQLSEQDVRQKYLDFDPASLVGRRR